MTSQGFQLALRTLFTLTAYTHFWQSVATERHVGDNANHTV